ncbi:hypothetical protein AMTRI_Chr02g221960 [Amborella trichopoda]
MPNHISVLHLVIFSAGTKTPLFHQQNMAIPNILVTSLCIIVTHSLFRPSMAGSLAGVRLNPTPRIVTTLVHRFMIQISMTMTMTAPGCSLKCPPPTHKLGTHRKISCRTIQYATIY